MLCLLGTCSVGQLVGAACMGLTGSLQKGQQMLGMLSLVLGSLLTPPGKS